MDLLRHNHAGRPTPHCEVVSRPINPAVGQAPSGAARLCWDGPTGIERTHDLHHWLRLDELFVPGSRFRVQLQARREPAFALPMFSAQREFTFTADPADHGDVAVGVHGDHGWVFGVIVVGAHPSEDPDPGLPDMATDHAFTGHPHGWGVVPGGVPPHVLRDLPRDTFPTGANTI